MSKEVKHIHKVGDNTFLFETYEKPLRTQIEKLKQQLAEKDKEIEKYRNANMIVVGGRSQGKKHLMEIKIKELQNQKAIEQLEKAKEKILSYEEIYYQFLESGAKVPVVCLENFRVKQTIDNQINELKGDEVG